MRKRFPCKWPGFSLLPWRAYREYTQAIAFEPWQVRLGPRRHRDHLPRHGAAVFHTGGPDLAHRNIEALRHLPGEELGAHVALFDP